MVSHVPDGPPLTVHDAPDAFPAQASMAACGGAGGWSFDWLDWFAGLASPLAEVPCADADDLPDIGMDIPPIFPLPLGFGSYDAPRKQLIEYGKSCVIT